MFICSYELSQDLLDKQIEMLERKYGGVRARNAALTIQRAFRRHTLLKKFAAITAMAKAEKRLSRKLHEMSDCQDQDKDPGHQMNQIYVQQQTQGQILTGRPTPSRSMSLREKRQGAVVDASQPPMARVLAGRCDIHVSPNVVSYRFTITVGNTNFDVTSFSFKIRCFVNNVSVN